MDQNGNPEAPIAGNILSTPDGALIGQTLTNSVGPDGRFSLSLTTSEALASRVRRNFEVAEQAKRDIETEAQELYGNYKGTFRAGAIEKAAGVRSKVSVKQTRNKVGAARSKLREIGFAFNLEPTTYPEVDGKNHLDLFAEAQQVALQIAQGDPNQGGGPDAAKAFMADNDPDTILRKLRGRAKDAAERMRLTIKDSFEEMNWESAYARGLFDLCLYGTMIFKGPLVKLRDANTWKLQGGKWEYTAKPEDMKLRPDAQNVSFWDFYPSPNGWTVEQLSYGIIRYCMNRNQLASLASDPSFDSTTIAACLMTMEGKYSKKNWEMTLDSANLMVGGLEVPSLFEVLEEWSFMTAYELRAMGLQVPPGLAPTATLMVNLWTCGKKTIKAWAVEMKPARLPFFVVPYEEGDRSIFGHGVAWMMKEWQEIINSVYRAMMDNTAFSAVPLGWFDRGRLSKKDNGKIFPGKMFEVNDTENASQPPAKFEFPPNNVDHMRHVADIAKLNIQESTSLPDITSGNQTGFTHNRTFGGMALLNRNADSQTSSVMANIGQHLIVPLVRAMFFWHMQFNPDPLIKGDHKVVAQDIGGVLAREAKAQTLMQFLQNAAQNQELAKRIDWEAAWELLARYMGMEEEGIMLSEDEVKKEEERQAQVEHEREIQLQTAAAQIRKQPEKTARDAALELVANARGEVQFQSAFEAAMALWQFDDPEALKRMAMEGDPESGAPPQPGQQPQPQMGGMMMSPGGPQ